MVHIAPSEAPPGLYMTPFYVSALALPLRDHVRTIRKYVLELREHVLALREHFRALREHVLVFMEHV